MLFQPKVNLALRVIIAMDDWEKVNGRERPITTDILMEILNVSQSYLEQIMPVLKKLDLVKAKRGVGGGYTLFHYDRGAAYWKFTKLTSLMKACYPDCHEDGRNRCTDYTLDFLSLSLAEIIE